MHYGLQYLRNKRRGLPAFRRLIGKPILQDVRLQDVVFAGGDGKCVQANAAADRACASRLSDLSLSEKKLEKHEQEAVRKGCGCGHNVWEPRQNGRAGCGFLTIVIII